MFWLKDYTDLGPPGSLHLTLKDEFGIKSVNLSVRQVAQTVESPSNASYGGFWGDFTKLGVASIRSCLRELDNTFPNADLLSLVLPPSYIVNGSCMELQERILKEVGFEAQVEDVCFFVECSSWTQMKMSHGNRKKLRQQSEAGVHFRPAKGNELEIVYSIIEANRLMHGTSPSLSLEQLKVQIDLFPTKFKTFLGLLDDNPIVSGVVVETFPGVQYVLYWADKDYARRFSPTTGLCEYLITRAKLDGARVLDLGGTFVNGVPNEGLARYKQNLGATATRKFRYTIKLREECT